MHLPPLPSPLILTLTHQYINLHFPPILAAQLSKTMAPCTKTIIFVLFMLLLLLFCFDSFSLSGGLVQRAEEGAANSAHPRTRRSDEGTDMVEVKLMVMRKLLEDIDFQLDYSPPGANPKHEVPPPAGKGKP